MKINFKGRKGMTMGFLVAIVITIIAFMFLSMTIFRFMSEAEDKEVEALCRDSVAIRAATTTTVELDYIPGKTEVKLSPILCKTQDKKLELDDKEKVKEEFADYMTRCWRMFGEGRYKTSVFTNTNLLTSGSNCFVCFTLLTDPEEKFDKISGQEFENYLRTEKYPRKKKMTYLDYFQYGAGQGYVMNIFTKEGISPGRAYAIAYKGKTEGGELDPYIGVAGAVAVVGGIGVATVASGGLFLGAVAAAGTGAAAAAYPLLGFFQQPIAIDGIYVVDLDKTIRNQFYDSCNVVSDIAGE